MSRHRNFVFTHNNYVDTELEDTLNCKYIAYSKEVAPTTGTPHLQGWVTFNDAKTKSAAIKLLKGCHVEIMMGSLEQNDTYCSKAGRLVERGDKPMSNDNKGRAEKLRWQTIWEQARSGNLDAIDADVKIRYYGTLKRIAKDYMVKPKELETGTCGLWIYGKSGTGKNHVVNKYYPDAYPKPLNKWWDGYYDQEVVHCDEIHPDMIKFGWGANLKMWADKWPFQAENKGGSITIRPKKFIITSNYSIDEMGFAENDLAAIKRRFREVEKFRDQDIII